MDDLREKVIRGLEWILQDDKFGFGENWDSGEPQCDEEKAGKIIWDTLTMLKAQEPRVMTLEEINGMEWDYCYVEDEIIMDKVQRMMYGNHRIHCITWPSIASYKMSYGEAGYGKRWRCWTSRPTDEQRKAVKWE